MKRYFLNEKIAFNYIDINKFKSNYLAISFIVPFEKRTSAMNALILKVLKRGTVSYPNMIELSKRLEYLYSADIFTKTGCFGEAETLTFAIDMLDNRFAIDDMDILEGTLEVLKEIIYSPILENGIFCQNYFESEKRNLLDDIASRINRKGTYALSRMSEHMFADEDFRLSYIGDTDEVEKFTNEEVFAQYKNILDNSKIEVSFVGHAEEERVKKLLTEFFENHIPKKEVTVETNVVRTVDKVKEIKEECVGTQGNLVMGFRTGTVLSDGIYPRMALLSELFGGSANSMLFMNVREKMSLCYFCSSIPEAIKGIMIVRAGIENKNYEVSKNAILDQLDAVKKGCFSDDELDAAKLSLINAYREIDDNPQSTINWYLGRTLSGISQSPEEAIKVVESITREEIVDTASRIMLDTVYFLEGVQKGGND